MSFTMNDKEPRMETRRSLDEIKKSLLKKRTLMEQTNYDSEEFDSMYKIPNDNFDDLEQHVYSTVR